jgi:membrane-associated protease RseP (regulator of RpoE activity)
MKAWLGRMPWAAGVILCAQALSAAPPAAEELRTWVRQLEADDFVSREAAEHHLIASGEAAIGPLAEAITGRSPEAAWRASAALEKIAVHGDEAAVARVAAALQQLSANQKPALGALAKELISKQRHARQERAAARIRTLGGKFDEELSVGDIIGGPVMMFGGVMPRIVIEPEEEKLGIEVPALDIVEAAKEPAPAAVGIEVALKAVDALLSSGADPKSQPAAPAPPPDDFPPETAPPAPALAAPAVADAFVGAELPALVELSADADQGPSKSLTIDRSWRGGDKGLAALGDLTNVISLSVHEASLTDAALLHIAALRGLQSLDIRSTPFSTAALAAFRKQRPEVHIFARGGAMLGVSSAPAGPCVLNSVFDGSAAAEAGLKVGDEIASVGDHKVRDFSDLTIAVFSRQPGDKADVEFQRDGKTQTVQVIFKERTTP